MIKKIILSLIIGLLIAFGTFLHEPWLHEWLESKIKNSFEETLNCSVVGKLQTFSLLFPAIYIEDMQMAPRNKDGGWHWQCKRFILRTHWWQLLTTKTIALDIDIEQFSGHSAFSDGKFAIEEHVQKMIEDTDLPVAISLNSVTIRDGQFAADDVTNKRRLACAWDSNVTRSGKNLQAKMQIRNASAWQDNYCFFSEFNGSFICDSGENQPLVLRAELSCSLPLLTTQPCSLSALFSENKLSCTVRGTDSSLLFDTITLHKENDTWLFEVTGQLALQSMLNNVLPPNQISGLCQVQLKGNLNNQCELQGSVTFKDVCHAAVPFRPSAEIFFAGNTQEMNGKLQLTAKQTMIEGIYKLDYTRRSLHLLLNNTTPLTIPFLDVCVPENSCSLACSLFDSKGVLNLEFQDANKQKIIIAQAEGNGSSFSIKMPVTNIRSLVKHCTQYDIQSDGMLHAQGHYRDNTIAGSFALHNGTIRLPQTYNFINALHGSLIIDLQKKKMSATDIHCKLHRGEIVCKNAQYRFADDGFTPKFIYAPFMFDSVLLHFKKDLFTILSGSLLFEKHNQEAPLIKGHILLDRTQLKENIFSLAFQKQLFSQTKTSLPVFDARFDVIIETKEPIRVRTPLLDTNVKAHLAIAGSLKEPLISGIMSIVSGSIALPYRPLFITKGIVSCLPNTVNNPYIEFVAKNKIKKYNISMSISGSLQQPIILLESSPPLTQEQIISLLLGGSEDCLGGAISSALMHNIKYIIFDSEHSTSKLHTVINQLFSPLKHVHLVPSFSDQTGRAGLRGAIEIDIGERWHALIQKNFSLSEDIRFEAEYAVSDELTVRGFRDEHRDIGAEVEFRWKF